MSFSLPTNSAELHTGTKRFLQPALTQRENIFISSQEGWGVPLSNKGKFTQWC